MPTTAIRKPKGLTILRNGLENTDELIQVMKEFVRKLGMSGGNQNRDVLHLTKHPSGKMKLQHPTLNELIKTYKPKYYRKNFFLMYQEYKPGYRLFFHTDGVKGQYKRIVICNLTGWADFCLKRLFPSEKEYKTRIEAGDVVIMEDTCLDWYHGIHKIEVPRSNIVIRYFA